AYFTYQADKVLNEVAEKRLLAIKEFTELGSGFKIAMRDLSIRGAGNLLGAAQHGFIDSVGFDLYSQMLKEAIDARKLGKEIEAVEAFQTRVLLIVHDYIANEYREDGQHAEYLHILVSVTGVARELAELYHIFASVSGFSRQLAELYLIFASV